MNNVHLEPDLHAAAFLLTKGFSLLGVERVGRRFAFQFAPEAQPVAMAYRQGGTVVARDYADALTRLKDELYSVKFAEGNGNGEHGNYHRS